MSGRVRVTLADGRRVTGFRKTLRRNKRRDISEAIAARAAKCNDPAYIAERNAQWHRDQVAALPLFAASETVKA